MGRFYVEAFPVWYIKREDGVAEATQHPDTGKWWFRRTVTQRLFLRGEMRDIWSMSKWECPENQPDNPVKGMTIRRRWKKDQLVARPTGDQHRVYAKAMLPRDLSTPLPPKRPRGRPRKERHDDQERHPQS
ncbi:hypothetical protein FANBOY_00720 [Brevundimonas phage vB_BgoS-Fanboy]|nr:hypothetical protein FANBOY_00720 [Brevundimonas phage vB_BgoS-Fanboy]